MANGIVGLCDVALQVIIGGNNHVYRKIVSMPILPIGSMLHFKNIDNLHVHGYWWSDSWTVVWLSTFARLNSEEERYGTRNSMLLAQCFSNFPISSKMQFVAEGFVFTNQRAESFSLHD